MRLHSGWAISWASGWRTISLVIFSFERSRAPCRHRPRSPYPDRSSSQIGAQVLVGRENDGLILRDTLNDLDRIGGRAADVGQGLHLRRAVDITDHDMVRILLLELAEQRRRTESASNPPAFRSGSRTFLCGRDLGCLRHEMTPAKTMISASVLAAFWDNPRLSPI